MHEEPSDAPEVLAINFRKSNNRGTRNSDLERMNGQGYAFRTALSEAAVPGKTWLGAWTLNGWPYDPGDQGKVNVSNLGSPVPLLFGITDGRISDVETVPELGIGGLDGAVEIDMMITQGSVSGSLRATVLNHIEPVARVSDEWNSVTVEIPHLAGYLVGTAEKPLLIIYGIGTSTYIGPMGQDVYTANVSFTAEPLLVGMTREAFREEAASWGLDGG